jgi:hypothetical protein
MTKLKKFFYPKSYELQPSTAAAGPSEMDIDLNVKVLFDIRVPKNTPTQTIKNLLSKYVINIC